MVFQSKLGKGGKNGKWGKINSGKNKKTILSRSIKAGLKFPVGRIHRLLKKNMSFKNRVGGSAAVYTAAVLEYLTAEVWELAGLISSKQNYKRITPRHICLAIKGDEELDGLIKATIAGGGICPKNIPKDDLNKTNNKAKTKTKTNKITN